jgi:hypothetical protein
MRSLFDYSTCPRYPTTVAVSLARGWLPLVGRPVLTLLLLLHDRPLLLLLVLSTHTHYVLLDNNMLHMWDQRTWVRAFAFTRSCACAGGFLPALLGRPFVSLSPHGPANERLCRLI